MPRLLITANKSNKVNILDYFNRFRSTMQRATIAKVRYRKSPQDTRRTVKLKLTLTLVLTLTDTGGAVLTLMLG